MGGVAEGLGESASDAEGFADAVGLYTVELGLWEGVGVGVGVALPPTKPALVKLAVGHCVVESERCGDALLSAVGVPSVVAVAWASIDGVGEPLKDFVPDTLSLFTAVAVCAEGEALSVPNLPSPPLELGLEVAVGESTKLALANLPDGEEERESPKTGLPEEDPLGRVLAVPAPTELFVEQGL